MVCHNWWARKEAGTISTRKGNSSSGASAAENHFSATARAVFGPNSSCCVATMPAAIVTTGLRCSAARAQVRQLGSPFAEKFFRQALCASAFSFPFQGHKPAIARSFFASHRIIGEGISRHPAQIVKVPNCLHELVLCLFWGIIITCYKVVDFGAPGITSVPPSRLIFGGFILFSYTIDLVRSMLLINDSPMQANSEVHFCFVHAVRWSLSKSLRKVLTD